MSKTHQYFKKMMGPIKLFSIFFLILLNKTVFSESVYLEAKQYLDVETGKLIAPANILIVDGIIKSINPSQIPDKVTLIQKPTLTILPGLMDSHVHLPNDITPEIALVFIQEDDAMITLRGAKNAKTLLMAGFTTVRNLGQNNGENFVDVALSKASENGWIVAPHIVPCGHPLSITGGHLDPDMNAGYAPNVLPVNYRIGVADGVDEVIKAVRYQIKYGAKVIKIAASSGVLSNEEGAGDQQYSDEELKAIVAEASRHGIPVAAHAHGTSAIKAGVRSIEHGSLLNDESIRLMKKYGTYLVPTTYVADSLNLKNLTPVVRKKAEYILPLAKRNLEKAIQANVKIAFGTDSGVYPHGENAKEFAALVRHGMTPLNAIRAATLNAADLLNMRDRGQIKIGYYGDLIGVEENPLMNIRTLENVILVMKDGKVVKE